MINRVLGVAALILGGAAVLAPSEPVPDSIDGSGPVSRHHNVIEAESLAARIMERGTAGLRLVDLRSQSAFESYHIPGAVRLRAVDLGNTRLPLETIIVLYDEAESTAPRVWLLLRAQGYREVYVLSGGLNAWNDAVLHPPLPPGMGRESEFVERMERSRFFGGSPVPTPAHRAAPGPRPDSIPQKPESFDIGPGGCFY